MNHYKESQKSYKTAKNFAEKGMAIIKLLPDSEPAKKAQEEKANNILLKLYEGEKNDYS